MKRTYTLCIITSLIMCILAVGVHRVTRTEEKHLKVGFIFVGDEITPYTENFIKPCHGSIRGSDRMCDEI